MITSKYNWWMGERHKRRLMDINVKSSWPRKTRLNDVNLEKFGAKQPKF